VNEFSSSFGASLIRSGYRFPGSTVTAKTSCTAVSNRKVDELPDLHPGPDGQPVAG
jgi:hypothetical protein